MIHVNKIFVSLDNGKKVVYRRIVSKKFKDKAELNNFRKEKEMLAMDRYKKSIEKLKERHPSKDVKIECWFDYREINDKN